MPDNPLVGLMQQFGNATSGGRTGPGSASYLQNVRLPETSAEQYAKWLWDMFRIAPGQAPPEYYQMWMAQQQQGNQSSQMGQGAPAFPQAPNDINAPTGLGVPVPSQAPAGISLGTVMGGMPNAGGWGDRQDPYNPDFAFARPRRLTPEEQIAEEELRQRFETLRRSGRLPNPGSTRGR